MSIRPRISKQDILKLALVCAFPVHFWAILMVFKEAETMLTKRSLLFGLGFSGYVLGLALVESALFFGFIYLLTILFPKRWEGKTALATAGVLALLVAAWAISNQAYFLLSEQQAGWFEWIMLRVHYRQHQVFPLLIFLVIGSFALPVIFIPRSEKFRKLILGLIDNIILLAPFYLLFDLVGITFTILRNIT